MSSRSRRCIRRKHDTSQDVSLASTRDLISSLPDDVLSHIISNLSLKEGFRTTILSRRWARIFWYKTTFKFDVSTMADGVWEICENPCARFKDKFIRGFRQFILSFKGSSVISFCVSFCLGHDEAESIDWGVSLAIEKGARELCLNLYCGKCRSEGAREIDGDRRDGMYLFRPELLDGADATLKYLSLSECILGAGMRTQLSLLQHLDLKSVSLVHYDLNAMFTYLPNLRVLELTRCKIPKELSIVPLRLLEVFTISDCLGVEKIELSNPNLTKFKCDTSVPQVVKFHLSGIPKLRYFSYFMSSNELHYLFTYLPEHHPELESLCLVYLGFTPNWGKFLPERITTFSKVTRLVLFLSSHVEFCTLKMFSVLGAFPCLQNLALVTRCGEDGESMNEPFAFQHEFLKEVKINACRLHRHFRFALLLLVGAVRLERMVLAKHTGRCQCREKPIPAEESIDKFYLMEGLGRNVKLIFQ